MLFTKPSDGDVWKYWTKELYWRNHHSRSPFHGSGQYLRGTNKSASVDGIKYNLNINGMTEGPPLRISMRKAATIVIELFLNQHLIIVLPNGKHIREYP